MPSLNADVRQLLIAPVMEHSRKPDEVHERIERLVGGPYLEIYARRPQAGWMTWGNELPAPLDVAGQPIAHDSRTGKVSEDPHYMTPAEIEAAPTRVDDDFPDRICGDQTRTRTRAAQNSIPAVRYAIYDGRRK